jgi:hypothetical protein
MLMWAVFLFLSPFILLGVLVFGIHRMSADDIGVMKVLLVVLGSFAFVFWWIAEFKIIDWKGADSVREGLLFKDFFTLAESATTKQKFLYVTGDPRAEKALRCGRNCQSVLNAKLLRVLRERYPDVRTFGDYFTRKQPDVHLIGLDALLFEFSRDLGLQ